MLPALIESIKIAGLVLVADTSDDCAGKGGSFTRPYHMPEGVDGVLKGNGVLRFNETIDV